MIGVKTQIMHQNLSPPGHPRTPTGDPGSSSGEPVAAVKTELNQKRKGNERKKSRC